MVQVKLTTLKLKFFYMVKIQLVITHTVNIFTVWIFTPKRNKDFTENFTENFTQRWYTYNIHFEKGSGVR